MAKKKIAKRARTQKKRALKPTLITAPVFHPFATETAFTAALDSLAVKSRKKYFKSVNGKWIECDWDPDQQIYDNCHEVPASEVPKAWGGDGP